MSAERQLDKLIRETEPISLTSIATTTDVDRVTKIVAAAANRVYKLQGEAELAFQEWVKAQEQAEAAGLVVDLKISPGMSAALSEFKQRREHARVREIVGDEFSVKA